MQDVGKMADQSAECHTHGACVPPREHIALVVSGFSCKDLSKCSINYSKHMELLLSGEGSSSTTLAGTIAYLHASDALAYVGENVDELANITGAARQFVEEAFGRAGWVIGIDSFAHDKYGGCTVRSRVYILGLHPERCGINIEDARSIIEKAFATAKRCETGPGNVKHFLLARQDTWLRVNTR